MSVHVKDLGVQHLSVEAIDFCPTASATISGNADGGNIAEADVALLRAQMRETLMSR